MGARNKINHHQHWFYRPRRFLPEYPQRSSHWWYLWGNNRRCDRNLLDLQITPIKIRKINDTIHYCESNRKEQQNVTLLFDDNAEKYELTTVYVLEFQTELVFSKMDNTLLVNPEFGVRSSEFGVRSSHLTPHTSHLTPLSLLPTPYSLLPTPYSLLPTPYSLLPKKMIELLKDMGLGALIQMQIGGCVGLVIASTTALALNPISLLSGALIGAICGSFIRQQLTQYQYRNYVIIKEVIGYREHNH